MTITKGEALVDQEGVAVEGADEVEVGGVDVE